MTKEEAYVIARELSAKIDLIKECLEGLPTEPVRRRDVFEACIVEILEDRTEWL